MLSLSLRLYDVGKVLMHKLLLVSLCLCLLTRYTSSTVDEDEDFKQELHKIELCTPEQVHLAFGDSVSEMVLMWSTEGNCTTTVKYGVSQWGFHDTAEGHAVNFDFQNEWGVKFIHRVKLKDLKPFTTYYYRPISNHIGSGPFYFKTPPSGQEWSPLFLVYGDLGIHAETIPYIEDEVLSGEYTAVLHDGDFAYNLHDNRGEVGDTFMRLIQGISSQIPYMTSPGNHEIVDDSFSHYRHRFSMPHSDWPIPVQKMWYSMDIGPVHLISYSSEVFFTSNQSYVDTQHDWLLEDLRRANQNRDKCPWVIAMGHRPMYCSNDLDDDCTKPDSLVRKGLEDIFYHFGVDIVLQAHEHSYERLFPHYKGVVLSDNYTNPVAPIQLITGAAGSKHGIDPMSNRTDNSWSAFHMGNGSLNSFGRLHVLNSTHVFWEQKSVFESDLIDSIWIVQEKHGPFNTETLPVNISHEIEETIEATGGKPNFLETTKENNKEATIAQTDTTQRMAIGISFGVFVVVILFGVLIVKRCRRRRKTVRRWEQMDFNYGKKFYSPAKDMDKELDNDFEIDMSDGTLPTTKLLSDD